MRVIFGKYKGRLLKVPAGLAVRPTTGRMRDWICNVLRDEFVEAEVLDLFAGSGSLGLHALSMGARHCTFVEQSPPALKVLGQNLRHLQIEEKQALVLRRDVLRFLKEGAASIKVDLVFVDPPYESRVLEPLLTQLAESSPIRVGGLLVLEHPTGKQTPLDGLTLWKKKVFGRSTIQIYRNE